MDKGKIGRRERRRRIAERRAEGNGSVREFEKAEKTFENAECSGKGQSFGRVDRRDTYTVAHSKSGFGDGAEEESPNDRSGSRNSSYSLCGDGKAFDCNTYNVNGSPDENGEFRPIPAPRKRHPKGPEGERFSSDTDRDAAEIDLDDLRLKSPQSDTDSKPFTGSCGSVKSESVVAPVPKPRTTVKSFRKSDSEGWSPKEEPLPSSVESLRAASEKSDGKSDVSDSKESFETDRQTKESLESKELPLIADLQRGTKSEEVEGRSKKQKKSIGELFDLRGRKNRWKTFSSFAKLEKKKMPSISSVLKDLREEEGGHFEVEEEKTDFRLDSPPHYAEPAETKGIYVQSKNGFRLMERDEILRNVENKKTANDGNGGRGSRTRPPLERQNLFGGVCRFQNGGDGKQKRFRSRKKSFYNSSHLFSRMLEDSTVKTAVSLQKYWSRSMIYFHGVLGGFGFSHAATVTAIMLHHNYEPRGFIGIYSCLSLKIHYVFYTLTALCIVSCFDRVDIGHMNRRHWETAWKVPSMWVILCIYFVSFVLTFSNQTTEARFDAYPEANETELWNAESQNEIQVSLLQWYHAVWARDVLVLCAWLMISLTKFSDFLHAHIVNMAKYAESKDGERSLHRTAGPKGDCL